MNVTPTPVMSMLIVTTPLLATIVRLGLYLELTFLDFSRPTVNLFLSIYIHILLILIPTWVRITFFLAPPHLSFTYSFFVLNSFKIKQPPPTSPAKASARRTMKVTERLNVSRHPNRVKPILVTPRLTARTSLLTYAKGCVT